MDDINLVLPCFAVSDRVPVRVREAEIVDQVPELGCEPETVERDVGVSAPGWESQATPA